MNTAAGDEFETSPQLLGRTAEPASSQTKPMHPVRVSRLKFGIGFAAIALTIVGFYGGLAEKSEGIQRLIAPSYVRGTNALRHLTETGKSIRAEDPGFAELEPLVMRKLTPAPGRPRRLPTIVRIESRGTSVTFGQKPGEPMRSSSSFDLTIGLSDGDSVEGTFQGLGEEVREAYLEPRVSTLGLILFWIGVAISLLLLVLG